MEVLIVGAIASWLAGGLLLATPYRGAGTTLVVGSIAGWACVWLVMLGSDSHGTECSESHHEGELPALLVAIAWCALAVAVLRRPRRPLMRAGVVIGTGLLFAASLAYVLSVQPGC